MDHPVAAFLRALGLEPLDTGHSKPPSQDFQDLMARIDQLAAAGLLVAELDRRRPDLGIKARLQERWQAAESSLEALRAPLEIGLEHRELLVALAREKTATRSE